VSEGETADCVCLERTAQCDHLLFYCRHFTHFVLYFLCDDVQGDFEELCDKYNLVEGISASK
jgi:hypothetical protein